MPSTITRWNPLADLAALQREMDRMWTGIGVPMRSSAETEATIVMPSIDIMSRGQDMVIRADIPGATPENVDISVTDSMLTLKAHREESHETKDEDYVVRERSWGTYQRTMRLPRGVDPNSIHADFNDGVVEIVVPGGATETERDAVHVPLKAGTKTPKDQ
jgi:HSP20 family protein